MRLKFRYSVRMLRLSCAALVVAATVQAQSTTPEVMKELRRIEAAALKGSADSIRIEYTAKSRERPSDPMPRVYLAWLTLPSDDSWNQLKAMATIYPDNPWVHYGMGRIYAKWKMRDQAKAEVELTLKRDPKFYPGITVLGDLALSQDDGAQAEAQYRRALALDDDPLARAGLGLALLKQEKKAEAVEALKASIRAFPEQPVVLASLIPLLLEAKDPALLDAAQGAADLRPKDREARRTIADAALRRGRQGRRGEGVRSTAARWATRTSPCSSAWPRCTVSSAPSADEERVVQNVAASAPSNPEPCLRLAELRLAEEGSPRRRGGHLRGAQPRPQAQGAEARTCQAQGGGRPGLPGARAVPAGARARSAKPPRRRSTWRSWRADFKLPKKPLKGNVNSVYWSVAASLDKLFTERARRTPGVGRYAEAATAHRRPRAR